jgi:hypothetical protein
MRFFFAAHCATGCRAIFFSRSAEQRRAVGEHSDALARARFIGKKVFAFAHE